MYCVAELAASLIFDCTRTRRWHMARARCCDVTTSATCTRGWGYLACKIKDNEAARVFLLCLERLRFAGWWSDAAYLPHRAQLPWLSGSRWTENHLQQWRSDYVPQLAPKPSTDCGRTVIAPAEFASKIAWQFC